MAHFPEPSSESPRHAAPRTGDVLSGAAKKPRRKSVANAVHVDPGRPPEPGDPLVELLKESAKAAGPGFAASLLIHVAVLFALTFVVLRHERRKDLPKTLSGFNADRIGTAKQRKAIVPVEIETVKAEPADAGTGSRLPAEPERPAGAPAVGVRKPADVNVAGAFAARGAGGSGRGGGRGSGTGSDAAGGKGDPAVSAGLAWLAKQQHADGHWDLHQGYPDAGQVRTSTGATALALLPFLGAGHTHRDGPYARKLAQAVAWLLGIQKPAGILKGDFYDFDREGDAASFYAHAQATIALCEAFALTGDDRLRQPIHEGLAYIGRAQHPVTGGWKYRRHSEGDLSVFGWQIMAFESARMAGLDIPQNVLDKAAGFLDLVQEDGGARYRYEPEESKSPTPAMTAEGLLCRQYLGWPREHPALRTGVRYLMEPENLPDWSSGRRNIYHWYYAAQVLHNVQGEEWEEWRTAMRNELIRNQVKAGKAGGSWNPFQPAGAIDENADKGGRLYVTCLCLLTLEAEYRHLPLYRDRSP